MAISPGILPKAFVGRLTDVRCRGVDNAAVPEQPPAELFHYTSRSGLEGIVASGSMWATSVKQLNDTSEMNAVRGALVRALRSRAVDAPIAEGEVGRYMRGSKQILDDTAANLERGADQYECFVLCFSELADDFGMWKKFGSEYSLAFRSAAFLGLETDAWNVVDDGSNLASLHPMRQRFMKVRYVELTNGIGQNVLGTEIAERIAQAGPIAGVDEEAMVGLASVKSVGWASDREWRHFFSNVAQPGHGACYAPSHESPTGKTYIEVSISLQAWLDRVLVRPAPDAEHAAAIARDVLDARGLEQVPVQLSSLTLRMP